MTSYLTEIKCHCLQPGPRVRQVVLLDRVAHGFSTMVLAGALTGMALAGNEAPAGDAGSAPAQAADFTPEEQTRIFAAIERLKRDLLAECLLSAAEKKSLARGKMPATDDRDGPSSKDAPAAPADKDAMLARALERAEKALSDKKRAIPFNLTKQFQFGLGEEALIGLALVKAGVSPNHALIQRIWDDLQRNPPQTTYLAGVGLMLVEAMLHPPSGEAWPPVSNKKNDAEREKVGQWVNRVANSLMDAGHDGGWSYGLRSTSAERSHDHSNTQYAALGLKAARLSGWQPKPAAALTAWRSLMDHFLKAQTAKGPDVNLVVQTADEGTGGLDLTSQGWSKVTGQHNVYEAPAQARGWDYANDYAERTKSDLNMTIAGLTAIILARSELATPAEPASTESKSGASESRRKGKDAPVDPAAVDRAIRDGMAWVQNEWPKELIDGYGLYGIERLGVLGNLTMIGGHRWYRELAPKVAARVMSPKPIKATGLSSTHCERAFYLLFLVRGTSSAYAEPTTGGK